MHTFGKSTALAAGMIALTLFLGATMAAAYSDGGNDKDTAGAVEDQVKTNELSVSFDNAAPSTEAANVESFGGSTISRNGLSEVGRVFPEAGGAEMHRHLDGMGKTLEVIDRGHQHQGVTVVRGVPLVTGHSGEAPLTEKTLTEHPAREQIGGFHPQNGPDAFTRARNGSDPERNPEQAEIQARAERAAATARARLAEDGVQVAPATTPSEAIAAAAQAVGARNLAQMPRYVQSDAFAPGAGGR